jgi:isoleucyl-tRNA synthetase
MSFTADEAWEQIPACSGSVHEQRFPLLGGSAAELEKDKEWEKLWEVRQAVQAAMEPHRAAKTVGTSLDAAVQITLKHQADWDLLDTLGESLDDLLVVSSIARIADSSADTGTVVAVTPHDGTKCPRCWNHKGGHGKGEDVALCARCASVVA